MNRHYDGHRVREVLGKLRRLEREDSILLNIGADLIVGFPGETDKDFADTENLVREFEITQLHAFPFSGHLDHYSVPAGSYPDQIPNHIAQSRLKKLLKTWETVFEEFAKKNIGKTVRVLIEKISSEWQFSGWSENYLRVDETNIELLPGQKITRGKIVEWIYLVPLRTKTGDE